MHNLRKALEGEGKKSDVGITQWGNSGKKNNLNHSENASLNVIFSTLIGFVKQCSRGENNGLSLGVYVSLYLLLERTKLAELATWDIIIFSEWG